MSQKSLMTKLLADELISSMGCTEPSAIAYSVAYAKEHLTNNEAIKEIEFYGSSNILKNALCVHIPNTNLCGIKIIILLALTKCKSEDKLNILSNIDEESVNKEKSSVIFIIVILIVVFLIISLLIKNVKVKKVNYWLEVYYESYSFNMW